MRTKLKILVLYACVLSLSACAKITQSSTSLKPTTATTVVKHGSGLPAVEVSQNTIQGNWKNNCTQDPKTKGYYISIIAIQNAVMTVATTSYADAGCAYPINEENRISNIAILATSDMTRLTETFVSATYRPLNSVIANLFNQNSFCHISNWVSGISETVTTATNCAGLEVSLEFHVELFGNKELYLDDCATTGQTQCSSVRYVKL